jgi:peptidoglycan/xylan/chitin deacetylase (PgdA/CDA1 family)
MKRSVINSKLAVIGAIFFLVATVISMLSPPLVGAATTSPTPLPRISFTFDDSLASTYTQAAPTLAKYGLTGTDYVITGCVGMTTAPNTCRANTDRTYMTWAQIQALQNTSGWEIGSHTVNHYCLASNAAADPGDCQKNTLTVAQVDQELANSKSTLAANGINATDMSTPYGDFNNSVLAEIAKYYATMRQFKNAANNANVWPYSDYYLQDATIQEGTDTVASVEAKVDAAIANNQWLILTFHDIAPTPSTNPDDYQYGTSELDQIAAYVKAKQDAGKIQSVHVNQGLVTGDTNLLANSSFNSGIASGWTTDAPATITKDTGNNGSYPDPTNSIKLVSTSASTHLFSPKVSVDPNTTYLLKTFLNVKSITSGEVGFYIDEYNAQGNWVSGQWKKAENSSFVEDMNLAYKPTSVNVSKASLQIYVTGNPGITAYVDNTQWFPLQATVPTQTNLLPNGTFDNGIANGWSTDSPTNITKDTGSHGSPANPVNSISMKALSTSQNIHLFSPMVAVSSSNSYSINSYLNLTQATSGVVAYYIDEYDTNGNWISGQYKTDTNVVGAGNVGFQYVPSSSNVKKASLQVIVVGNSGIQAYFDDAQWYQN